MKAVEIRLNKIRFAKRTIEATRLREALAIDKFGTEKFVDYLCHNGCPKILGSHFTQSCVNTYNCNKCWEQQPFEFKKTNPRLYNK